MEDYHHAQEDMHEPTTADLAKESMKSFSNSERGIEASKSTSEDVEKEKAQSCSISTFTSESREREQSVLNSTSDIESGKPNTSKKQEYSHEKKMIFWLPIGGSTFIILLLAMIALCFVFGETKNYDEVNGHTYTTHRFRFPDTKFDECCGNEEKKRMYLDACNENFKNDNIKCVNVTRGSAIVTTKSTNPKHESIIRNKFTEITHINEHSCLKAHYYGEHEEKEKNKKTEQEIEIGQLKLTIKSLQTKNEMKKNLLQKQNQEIQVKKILLQEQKQKIQVKELLLQAQKQKIQDKDAQLQQNNIQLEEKHQEIAHKDTQLKENSIQLEEKKSRD